VGGGCTHREQSSYPEPVPGPYRDAVAAEILQASTREGDVELEVAPRYVHLRVGPQLSLTVTERFAELRKLAGNRHKKRSLRLQGAKLLVARTVPTDDIGLWHESTPGVVTRLFGLRKFDLDSAPPDTDFNEVWREFDRLGRQLEQALAPHRGEVERAIEVGIGADRVLVMDFGEYLLFHVRRLFREHPRRAFEVHRDGTVVVLLPSLFHAPAQARILRVRSPRALPRIQCRFRFGVSVIGDHIRFANEHGEDLGRVSLPWIRPEDRAHLAEIITDTIAGTDSD
jgi:hypothetical protein